MWFKQQIEKVANIGVKPYHLPWEIFLIRKQNLVTILGIFNLLVSMVIFNLIGYHDMVWQVACCLLIAPFVYILNLKVDYVAASYAFASVGYVVFFVLSVRLGQDSLSFLYYFPLMIGMTQMLGRREMIKHLIIQLAICFFAIFLASYCSRNGFLQSENFGKNINEIKVINIVFSIFTTMVFVIIITIESIKQEDQLKAAVKQKEVLLAELFHRVKNNLNIVTSILNLKKNSIVSDEGKNAIEECRNMVFSMAMVHTKIYNSKNVDNLNFKDYISDLINELVRSLGGNENVDIEVDAVDVNLNVSQAIPCAIIINELITNAFKHARVQGKKLIISVSLKENIQFLTLSLKDNGPGRSNQKANTNSLGLELIKSLSEQMDADYEFLNNDGFQFVLKLKK
jgi:two-component sensor histidine kinase